MVGIIDSVDLSLSKLQGIVKDGEAWRASWGHKKLDTTEQMNNKSLSKHDRKLSSYLGNC